MTLNEHEETWSEREETWNDDAVTVAGHQEEVASDQVWEAQALECQAAVSHQLYPLPRESIRKYIASSGPNIFRVAGVDLSIQFLV